MVPPHLRKNHMRLLIHEVQTLYIRFGAPIGNTKERIPSRLSLGNYYKHQNPNQLANRRFSEVHTIPILKSGYKRNLEIHQQYT